MIGKNETLLGIDYGDSNIGIALGVNGFVKPLEVISGKNEDNAIYKIIRLGLENKVSKFIVGLPLDAEDKDTPQSLNVRMFANKLKLASKKPVYYQNEFGTSKQALQDSIDQGISQRKRRSTDHLSAGIILKRYFEDNSSS